MSATYPNDSFKGAKISRAKPFNDWAVPAYHCSYGRSSTRFYPKIASTFKKVLDLKDLNH